MNTGSRLWISSEEMSMNIETKPSAQMPVGKPLAGRKLRRARVDSFIDAKLGRHAKCACGRIWWLWLDSNQRPQHYECCALTS